MGIGEDAVVDLVTTETLDGNTLSDAVGWIAWEVDGSSGVMFRVLSWVTSRC